MLDGLSAANVSTSFVDITVSITKCVLNVVVPGPPRLGRFSILTLGKCLFKRGV